jgi:hypothetical protein
VVLKLIQRIREEFEESPGCAAKARGSGDSTRRSASWSCRRHPPSWPGPLTETGSKAGFEEVIEARGFTRNNKDRRELIDV